ncbi:MAG: dTDP-4-amino-4,6-dideoxygalactose transaminase [Mucilaginibacter sp.]
MIPFNKIHITGNEIAYMQEAMESGKIAGDGRFTKLCEHFFENKYGFKKALLISSCTDALELSALLINIKSGDEVIMPSYSFSSTANAFLLRGAKIIFADSCTLNPNIDADLVEPLITAKTKAIVIVHYGGIACDMYKLKKLADKYKIYLVEDAAQAVDCYYNNTPLGGLGHLATFSFHETKNITCGEGGLLVINDEKLIKRAEVIREKGTTRSAFIRDEVKRYDWIDIGSSFLLSDITAAYLFAQLEKLDEIQAKRRIRWQQYFNAFEEISTGHNSIKLPAVPEYALQNGHVFYIVCKTALIRDEYISYMLLNGVQVKSHYITLHDSPFYKTKHGNRKLPVAKNYQQGLVRLPLFFDMSTQEINKVITLTNQFFKTKDAFNIEQ